MFNISYLKELIIISIVLSTVTCTLVQKTKGLFKNSKIISLYSLVINMTLGTIFCYTFTDITLPNSLWIGFFSFLGADSIYKSLEGKIASYTDIINKNTITISKDNIINKEEE